MFSRCSCVWQMALTKTTIVCKTQACFANGCCFHQRQNHTQARRENIEVKWPPHIYVVAVIQINNSILSFTEILWHKRKALVIHPSLPRIFIRLCLLAARLAFLQTLMRWKDFSAAALRVAPPSLSLPPSLHLAQSELIEARKQILIMHSLTNPIHPIRRN